MNIQPFNFQHPNPTFKSAYPVVHWVRETNGSFAPVVTSELSIKLQKAIVRMLNNQGKQSALEKEHMRNYVKQIVAASDKDYASSQKVRSFYNLKGGWGNNSFEPLGYIVSGQHAEHLTETFGKPIGRAKGSLPRLNNRNSAEVNIVLGDYWHRGFNFVKRLAAKFKGADGRKKALHTKFEIIRSKTGKIKEFRLLDLKFCPAEGADSPFVRTGYLRN